MDAVALGILLQLAAVLHPLEGLPQPQRPQRLREQALRQRAAAVVVEVGEEHRVARDPPHLGDRALRLADVVQDAEGADDVPAAVLEVEGERVARGQRLARHALGVGDLAQPLDRLDPVDAHPGKMLAAEPQDPPGAGADVEQRLEAVVPHQADQHRQRHLVLGLGEVHRVVVGRGLLVVVALLAHRSAGFGASPAGFFRNRQVMP